MAGCCAASVASWLGVTSAIYLGVVAGMGLCINWTIHAPETASLEHITDQLRIWREACLDLPFVHVTEIVHFTEAEIVRRTKNHEDPFRWLLIQAGAYVVINRDTPDEFSSSVDAVEVVGFTAFAGAGCEPMNCFLARYPEEAFVGGHRVRPGISGWRGSSFTKTQYASTVAAQHFLKCHLTITAALDAAKAAGLLKSVLDEGEYWEDRDAEKLLKTVGRWNALMAAFVGSLETATGESLPAPIKEHPEFEKLEHIGTLDNTAAMAKAIAATLKQTKPDE